MSTAHLPPERRAEIARNAIAKRKSWATAGRKPCHSPADPACKRCRRREIERRSQAAGTNKRLLATSLSDWLEYLPLDYDDRGTYRGGPPLDEKTEYFPLIKER